MVLCKIHHVERSKHHEAYSKQCCWCIQYVRRLVVITRHVFLGKIRTGAPCFVHQPARLQLYLCKWNVIIQPEGPSVAPLSTAANHFFIQLAGFYLSGNQSKTARRRTERSFLCPLSFGVIFTIVFKQPHFLSQSAQCGSDHPGVHISTAPSASLHDRAGCISLSAWYRRGIFMRSARLTVVSLDPVLLLFVLKPPVQPLPHRMPP